MLLADVVATSAAVGATPARTAKVAALADLLARLEPHEVAPVVGFLTGRPRQGRVGVGWATMARAHAAAVEEAADGAGRLTDASLSVSDVDRAIDQLQAATGPGSAAVRGRLLADLLRRAGGAEAEFVFRLFTGEVRQGALEGLMVEAVARAAGVPAAAVRRALLLSGDLGAVAGVALGTGREGLEAVGLRLLRPLAPMLAAPADSVAEALAEVSGPASVEWKLDGVRIQAHRDGDEVRLFTRNLNDVTHRLPDVVAAVLGLRGRRLVLDGEVVGVGVDNPGGGRPQRFQDVMSGFGRDDHTTRQLGLRPSFFDCLHREGEDLVDRPLRDRLAALAHAVPAELRIPSVVTTRVEEAAAFLEAALGAGHEGVVVKDLDQPYQAGRRGRGWRKVKVATTVDLVVLAAEWGHGRRRGWLSNLHLGARDPADPGRFLMVGKTFKGMTDELLRWQTEALRALVTEERGRTVFVRPELVVEIELDGVQVSTRYPGGVALRFARVLRYRPDKTATEADTIDTVRALLSG